MIRYRDQDGCYNCAHVFVSSDYDTGPGYYCHADRSTRPHCMSVAMGECPDVAGARDAWDEWATVHEVQPWGTCLLWERSETEKS